ncbi:O-methyltransferase glim-like protein, partial [Amylocarpus encephaloides]
MVEKVKNSGVLISAGRSFHGPEDERGWARIGFAVPEEQLEKAVVILDGVFENEKENAGIVGDSLTQLIGSLESVLNVLKRDGQSQLLDALHDPENLPDARLSRIANHAIDLLHETEQLLEPGSLVLADHFLGYVNSKCLCAAVELNIPDLLKSGPKKLYDLAKESKAQPKRLRQVLRVLHNNGIFSYEGTSDSYSINSTSALLVSDHWTQWRNWVDLYGNEFYDMARGIPESCKEGNERTAAQINFDTDTDMFTYFTERGWLPRLHKTLGGGAVAQAPGILEDYPWEEVADRRLLDVGGGGGALVASLLRKHKNMRGGILDIPSVIEHARQNFHGVEGEFADVGNRVDQSDLIVGDFLTAVPSFEVYTMKWCLHDWDDLKALRVMKNIRSGIVRCQQSRLIILESLLTDGRMGRLSRYGDLIMMISANGQERTETQWTALAQRTGWLINKIYHLRNSWPCAIELFP